MCVHLWFFLFVLCFRLTGWVLLKLFNSFFWNIQIHKGQLEMVKAATEARISVNLLPHFPLISRVILEFLWKYSLVYCYVFQPIWKISLFCDNFSSCVFGEEKWDTGVLISNMQDSFCKLPCNNPENLVEQSLFCRWSNRDTDR